MNSEWESWNVTMRENRQRIGVGMSEAWLALTVTGATADPIYVTSKRFIPTKAWCDDYIAGHNVFPNFTQLFLRMTIENRNITPLAEQLCEKVIAAGKELSYWNARLIASKAWRELTKYERDPFAQ